MLRATLTAVFAACMALAQSAPAVNTPLSSWPAGPIPVWLKCTVTNTGANLVVSGTGCTTGSTAKAGALTQSITLFQLPANGYVHNFRIKSSTAFAGTTTLLAGLGTATNANFFLVSAVTGYDLNAAVAVANITTALPLFNGSTTTAAVNIVLSLTSTVQNLSSISQGACDVWVLYSVLP